MPAFQLKLLLTISFITLFPVINGLPKGGGVRKVASSNTSIHMLVLTYFPSFPWLLGSSGKLCSLLLFFSSAITYGSNKCLYLIFYFVLTQLSFAMDKFSPTLFFLCFWQFCWLNLNVAGPHGNFCVQWKWSVSWYSGYVGVYICQNSPSCVPLRTGAVIVSKLHLNKGDF